MGLGTGIEVCAIGETLIDFVNVESATGSLDFSGNAGGAPANVLAALAKLGHKTAFVGKVGADVFGNYLKARLAAAGIETGAMVTTKTEPTTLAFVSLDETGDRDFSFYRNNTADCMLRPEEVDPALLREVSLLHFGSVSMTDEPSRSATLGAAQAAREGGAAVAFDPNLRRPLWPSLDEAKTAIYKGLELADFVKLSDDELRFLTGIDDIETAAAALWEQTELQALVVTLGPAGAYCLCNGYSASAKAYAVNTIDTTGAGDAFWGAFLHRLLLADLDCSMINQQKLEQMLRFANAAGSLATAARGAIPAMPDQAAIERCLREVPLLDVSH